MRRDESHPSASRSGATILVVFIVEVCVSFYAEHEGMRDGIHDISGVDGKYIEAAVDFELAVGEVGCLDAAVVAETSSVRGTGFERTHVVVVAPGLKPSDSGLTEELVVGFTVMARGQLMISWIGLLLLYCYWLDIVFWHC